MATQMIRTAAVAMFALALAGTADAQRRFTDAEIVGAIGKCLSENAPDDWRTLIFKLDPAPAAAGREAPAVVEHKMIAGAEGSAPQDVKPCRPDYASKAVETFRESQDEKARSWTGITVTVNRDGRYSINFRYPK
jgi:hypothetical protein